MNDFEKYCLKSHGYVFSDSESDGESEFDETYYNLKPPPIPYNEIKDRIKKIDKVKENLKPTINLESNDLDTKSEKNLLKNTKSEKNFFKDSVVNKNLKLQGTTTLGTINLNAKPDDPPKRSCKTFYPTFSSVQQNQINNQNITPEITRSYADITKVQESQNQLLLLTTPQAQSSSYGSIAHGLNQINNQNITLENTWSDTRIRSYAIITKIHQSQNQHTRPQAQSSSYGSITREQQNHSNNEHIIIGKSNQSHVMQIPRNPFSSESQSGTTAFNIENLNKCKNITPKQTATSYNQIIDSPNSLTNTCVNIQNQFKIYDNPENILATSSSNISVIQQNEDDSRSTKSITSTRSPIENTANDDLISNAETGETSLLMRCLKKCKCIII